MAFKKRHWSLRETEFSAMTLRSARAQWYQVPDEEIRELISTEEQLRQFHKYLRFNLLSYAERDVGDDPREELGLSLRAGFVRYELFSAGSIIESVLRAHLEKLGLSLKKNATLGLVIDEAKHHIASAVSAVLEDLYALKDVRNTVHLYAALEQMKKRPDTAYWQQVLDDEVALAERSERVLSWLRDLRMDDVRKAHVGCNRCRVKADNTV